MKLSILFRALCMLTVAASLILSLVALTELSECQETGRALNGRQQRLIMRMDEVANRLEDIPEDTPTGKEEEPTLFRLTAVGDGIAVYTEDGLLVKKVTLPLSLLPVAERRALEGGLVVGSWEEVLEILEDYDLA